MSAAMLHFVDGRYFLAVWFVAGDKCDFMGGVFREHAAKPWQVRYRFRYYRDGETFDSKDERYWYAAESASEQSENEVERIIDDVAAECARAWTSEVQKLVMRTANAERCASILAAAPFAHAKEIPS